MMTPSTGSSAPLINPSAVTAVAVIESGASEVAEVADGVRDLASGGGGGGDGV